MSNNLKLPLSQKPTNRDYKSPAGTKRFVGQEGENNVCALDYLPALIDSAPAYRLAVKWLIGRGVPVISRKNIRFIVGRDLRRQSPLEPFFRMFLMIF
jgi:hypothetical protein